MKVSEKSTDLLIKAGLVGLAYLIFAKPLFNKLGITKSRADRILKRVEQNPDSPFKPAYFQKYDANKYPPFGVKITAARYKELQKLAKSIGDAMGYFYDDESKISGAFHKMKTKAEVSIVSSIFYNAYKEDFLGYLARGRDLMPQNGLGDDDLNIIITYVNSLPNK